MLGYLGPSGTFSHQAALEWLDTSGSSDEIKQYPTIFSAIKAVDDGQIDRCIVPIENSIEGSINTTLDMLAFDVDLYITGEYVLKVSENLMVKRGSKKEDIKVITSHPQPIGQCARLISSEFPNAAIEYADSTSAAAKRVSECDGTIACIGSPNSADIYGLDILYENCGDDKNNSTRFVILEKNPCMRVSGHDKTSIAFTLEDRPGILYTALELFAAANINLKKIESRPMKNELGKYMFFIDIDGNIDNATIYFALDKLKTNTLFYKFLGSYHYDK